MIFLGYYIQKKQEFTFFSSTQETFSRIDHQLGHKMSLNKFKSIEIISSISSDHEGIKLELNYRKKNWEKKWITWRLNSILKKKKKTMGQWWNQRGNLKIPWEK